MSAVCIIPAKGTSRRVPFKNRRLFYGKPIIEYSIEAAKESRLFDKILVSSDDAEILGIAERAGCHPLRRHESLCGDEVGTQEVAHAVLEYFRWPNLIHEWDFACVIYATAPLMSVRDLQQGFLVLQRNPRCDFAYSVCGDPPVDAGQFYWSRAPALLAGLPLDPYAENVWRIGINRERFCDINTEADFLRAERMYLELHKEMA